jgi:hypothetical protein
VWNCFLKNRTVKETEMKTLLLIMVMTACNSTDSQLAHESSSESSNTDIQVIAAKDLGPLHLGVMDNRFDAKDCNFFDKEPLNRQSEFTHSASGDCTEMIEEGTGLSLINSYVAPLFYIRESDQGIGRVSSSHFCHELEILVAIKEAAYHSPEYKGMGFYAKDDSTLLAAANDMRFFSKDSGLSPIGRDQLKSGESVLLFKFIGAGSCATAGSGQAPTSKLSFKPFVDFAGGHRRWEAVAENHKVGSRDQWDRSSDLLQ